MWPEIYSKQLELWNLPYGILDNKVLSRQGSESACEGVVELDHEPDTLWAQTATLGLSDN